jgi:membrane protein implicated in regulation of membrane protease activity
MSLRIVAFLLAALGGIVMFAVGGAYGNWPLQIAGLALEIGCLAVAWRWFARQHKPPAIKPAANPAWSMREQPPPTRPPEPPAG